HKGTFMTSSPSGSFNLKQSLKRILVLFLMLVFTCAALGIASRLGAEHAQLLELLSHFQVQYTLALLISGLGLAALYSRRWLIATGILLIPNLLLIGPYYWT